MCLNDFLETSNAKLLPLAMICIANVTGHMNIHSSEMVCNFTYCGPFVVYYGTNLKTDLRCGTHVCLFVNLSHT